MKILFFVSLFFAFLLSKLLLIQKQFSVNSNISQDILAPILNYVKHLMELFNLSKIHVYPIIKFNEHGFEHMVFIANVLLNYTPVFFIALTPVFLVFKLLKFLKYRFF